ncbi:hypothetical protein ABFT80_07255 [Mesorhizobium sp. SB112]|uniref:hypothetical protein n=1 Tax=Mesorhizobium sp. SB112 TaxID=3151853 RepID=UPI003264C59E
MLTFTLDTNCIIDVADNRPEADGVIALAKAHAEGKADVAFVAVSASERQPGDRYLDSYSDFHGRLEALGLDHLTELKGIAYMDISYWDHSMWGSDEMTAREEAIHRVLFPNIAFRWTDFATSLKIDVNAIKDEKSKRWRNAFCDRQMFWAHDHGKRDIFVTSDANFQRLAGHTDFPNAVIFSPREAFKHIS